MSPWTPHSAGRPDRGGCHNREPSPTGWPADHQPGLALDQAVDRKHRAYPELRQARRCRLVVFGMEVGGRVSRGTLTFLRLLARARARQRATGPEPALESPGRVRSAPRLLAPRAALQAFCLQPLQEVSTASDRQKQKNGTNDVAFAISACRLGCGLVRS